MFALLFYKSKSEEIFPFIMSKEFPYVISTVLLFMWLLLLSNFLYEEVTIGLEVWLNC